MNKIVTIDVIDETDNTTSTLSFNWTSKHPSKSGFYYYKYPNSDDITIIDVTVINPDNSCKPKCSYFLGNSFKYDILDLSGTFYGPIPEP